VPAGKRVRAVKRANPERLGRMRKTVLLLLSMALALLVASGIGLLNAEKPAEATFPGQNGKIAYASSDILPDGSTTDTEIYTINPTGGMPLQLTNNERRDTDPSYSPDGQRIAYTHTDGDSEIYTINASGGTSFQVTNNTTTDEFPSYSPDGQRIAFSRWDGTDYEIYTVNAAGGGEFQVTNNDNDDFSPDYSPNGEKIAYGHCLIPYYQEEEERCGDLNGEVDYTEIFTIKATGGTPFRVTYNETHDSGPSYSPNGQKIAYSGTDVSDLGSDFEIYKINATGGTPVNVTHNKKDDIGPSYSPNGRKIAYFRWDENPDGSPNAEIYKIHHNGGTPVRVTISDSWDVAPSWGSRP
jgi:Tol biopolymer transport system component